MSFLSFLSETFLKTRIDQGESLTILRRTYQTATSHNRLWHPFKQPNQVSNGVSIRPVQSDKETIDNIGSHPTRIVSSGIRASAFSCWNLTIFHFSIFDFSFFILVWFLNLFIVLEPSLNIEGEFVFLFVSSVEKKKKRSSAISKESSGHYKKKKKRESL